VEPGTTKLATEASVAELSIHVTTVAGFCVAEHPVRTTRCNHATTAYCVFALIANRHRVAQIMHPTKPMDHPTKPMLDHLTEPERILTAPRGAPRGPYRVPKVSALGLSLEVASPRLKLV
jgi:hypothetical protein